MRTLRMLEKKKKKKMHIFVRSLSFAPRRSCHTDFCDEQRCTALIHATRNGRQAAVAWLVSVGCAVDAQDVTGSTALVHAVTGGQCACGATLVDAGASLDAVDLTGKSALIHAVTRTGPDAAFFIELLIAAGADLNVRDKAHGWTALHWAMFKVCERSWPFADSKLCNKTQATLLAYSANLISNRSLTYQHNTLPPTLTNHSNSLKVRQRAVLTHIFVLTLPHAQIKRSGTSGTCVCW